MKKSKAAKRHIMVEYRDEDIDAFVIVEQTEWDEYLAKIRKLSFPAYADFGSDKGVLTFRTLQDYELGITVKPLKASEHRSLMNVFPYGSKGDFPWLDVS